MRTKHSPHASFFRTFTTLPSIIFIFIILISSVTACNMPSMQSTNGPKLADKNAQMYQMYFDSSPDPSQNELQVRRFIGQLHMPDLEDIFGDIQALPQDENCNYVGGPVEHEGLLLYITVTPDLVGANLISIASDGTRSSAFDLDGDRIVDILDIRLSDLRRVSFVTEKLGLDVFKYFLQNRNPFCDSELIRQLRLPELGCGDTEDSSSGVGSGNSPGFFPGTNIIDPIEAICSEYDTGRRAELTAGNPNQGHTERSVQYQTFGNTRATSETMDMYDAFGNFRGTDRQTTYVDVTNESSPMVVIIESVDEYGNGVRLIFTFHGEGRETEVVAQRFTVSEQDRGRPNFNGNQTSLNSGYPVPQSSSPSQENNENNENSDSPSPDEAVPDGDSPTQGNPGPDGDDSTIEEFCRRRANHQSGIEQALADDPTSMGVSCGDLVGAPSNPNCMIIEWATELDFMSVLDMAGDDGNCDPNGERGCEPPGVDEQISRFRGMTAELWSLNLPSINFCPAVVCDPALEGAMQTYSYTAGEVEFSCAEIPEEPTLEPSEENCPAGTYYAPVTNRCIEIQIQPAGGNGGNGGNSGVCTLSTSACTSQGLSFDSVNCACVTIQ